MAQEQDNQQPTVQSTFTGGMIKDLLGDFLNSKKDTWYHARNATNNLPDGQIGGLSTEPANILCVTFPFTLIGAISLADDQWCVFLTDNTTSEIGIFKESQCLYTTLTGPQTCPGFNKNHLIIGASRRGYDCGFDVYWSDGRYNPDRFINTAKVPFIQVDTTPTGPCRTFVDTTVLDCEKLRIAPHYKIPCLSIAKSEGSGQLPNGTYQVVLRYAINSIPCTDYVTGSPVISIWSHNSLAGAVRLTISGADQHIFKEMEVVLVSEINKQVVARKIGVYSTYETVIYISNIDETSPIVPLSEIPLVTPAIERSDAIYSVSSYLCRIGTTTAPDPNYQLLANKIRAKWVAVLYSDDYYHKGGNELGMVVSHLRGEVYQYFIRWVRLSGDKTSSFHIPGLPAGTAPTMMIGGPSVPGSLGTVASGYMEGYSSTEKYPDQQPAVWGSLCGLPIMHHKFPDQASFGTIDTLSHFNPNGTQYTISVMGVVFENIQLPVDINGNIIQDIQGYEILRSSRDGHKSIIAKGMMNHMRGYTKSDGTIGLYQNYPYDDLAQDPYLCVNPVPGGYPNYFDELTIVSKDVASFHSPDTTFQNPYLGTGTFQLTMMLELTMMLGGASTGIYERPYKHPKFKLLTDLASGFGIAIGSMVVVLDIFRGLSGMGGGNVQLGSTSDVPINVSLGMFTYPDGGSTGLGYSAASGAAIAFNIALGVVMGFIEVNVIQAQIMTIINGLVPAKQYATQYNSHGFYNIPIPVTARYNTGVLDYQYIKGYLQTFAQYDINNLYRNDYVALNCDVPAIESNRFFPTGQFAGQPLVDISRWTLGLRSSFGGTDFGPYTDPVVSYYGAYKVAQPAQYGQIGSTKEVPISCMYPVDVTFTGTYTTPVLFGGDTYINRYTEKNPMLFFNDWLLGQDTDYPYDYTIYENVPYPRYWINNTKVYYDFWNQASKNWHLDENRPSFPPKFYVENGFFYLFCNGVRDFYVESDVNVGYRDWEDDHSKRFYDPYGYTTLEYMFRSDIIKSDVFYKYDYSLSAGLFWNQYLSWGQTQSRDYDPTLAYTCFSYYPRRVHYSLSQDTEMLQDNWRMFLPNNYKDFPSTVTAVEDSGNNGALFLLYDRPPIAVLGLQTIPSASGVDYTVGAGNLFDQAQTTGSNADQSLQYGSCQNRRAVINTPHGVFWVSRNTGKVFNYIQGSGMQDITPGIKWHLSQYLPSQLLAQYPDYPYNDNPLTGIGVQLIYDAINELLYICKKDYRPLPGVNNLVYYDVTNQWSIDTGYTLIPISSTDTNYFEDCSWTLSYDCKNKQWVAFHDWHPALSIGSKTHFLTTDSNTANGASLWRHNKLTNLFCNYYGQDKPWEVEYSITTGGNMTTLESIEYFLTSFNYQPNQTDKFLMYDNTFNYAVISNDEQSTGPMFLVPRPWDNPYAIVNYPDFTSPLGIGILQSKVENKYRFNFIKDWTKDRFQFGLGMTQYWVTAGNGYVKSANPLYLDYLKPWNQQKKLRYRNNRIFLRRSIVGYRSMTFYFSNSKHDNSPR